MIIQSDKTNRTTGSLDPARRPRLYPLPRVEFPAVLLSEERREEALSFLLERPLHTFGMTGLIRDNGLVSPRNRGTFYGYYDQRGKLEGVALIGHSTLFEARTQRSLEAFARAAQTGPDIFMLLGERTQVELFWSAYSQLSRTPSVFCSELLLEKRWPVEALETVEGLRPATLDDLGYVAPVHAALATEESGVNPLESDAEGFLQRCARRIERGRTWVWIENGELIFKADVVSDTPGVIYLEGVWVSPHHRGRHCGLRSLSQLCANLLRRTKSVCLLVNERNVSARRFYERAGFKFIATYDSVFLHSARSSEDSM